MRVYILFFDVIATRDWLFSLLTLPSEFIHIFLCAQKIISQRTPLQETIFSFPVMMNMKSHEAKKIDRHQLLPEWTRHVVVAGLTYGDEGKWKVAASLHGWYTVVAGVNGWWNAGHNVMVNGKKEHFHELPGAALHANIVYLGQGKVVNIQKITQEVEQLRILGNVPHIVLAAGAHIVIPAVHVALEKIIEASKREAQKIWSTFTGMWPVYGLKSFRLGVNVGQLLYAPEVVEQEITTLLTLFPMLNDQVVREQFQEAKEQLMQAVATQQLHVDLTNTYITTLLQESTHHVITECSQSVMLSLSGGQYPFVTSSECWFTAIPVHLNIADSGFKIGITKAIASKVWWGRFPTQRENAWIPSEIIDVYRADAGEFGATTGRPRRIWFLDAVQLRYVFRAGNRPDLLWINMGDKLPFLSAHGIPNKIAVAYKTTDPAHPWQEIVRTDTVPPAFLPLTDVVYETLPDVRSANDYPAYVLAIKKLLWFDGKIVLGIGPGGDDNVLFE